VIPHAGKVCAAERRGQLHGGGAAGGVLQQHVLWRRIPQAPALPLRCRRYRCDGGAGAGHVGQYRMRIRSLRQPCHISKYAEQRNFGRQSHRAEALP